MAPAVGVDRDTGRRRGLEQAERLRATSRYAGLPSSWAPRVKAWMPVPCAIELTHGALPPPNARRYSHDSSPCPAPAGERDPRSRSGRSSSVCLRLPQGVGLAERREPLDREALPGIPLQDDRVAGERDARQPARRGARARRAVGRPPLDVALQLRERGRHARGGQRVALDEPLDDRHRAAQLALAARGQVPDDQRACVYVALYAAPWSGVTVPAATAASTVPLTVGPAACADGAQTSDTRRMRGT